MRWRSIFIISLLLAACDDARRTSSISPRGRTSRTDADPSTPAFDGGPGHDAGFRDGGPPGSRDGTVTGDATTPPIGSDGGTSGCQSVCFEWTQRTPPMPGPPMTVRITDCNYAGLDRGSCPSGFRCGRDYELGTLTFPVCEPTGSSPFRLDFDIPEPPRPTNPVQVRLRFTMNGGAWPTVASGASGSVAFTPSGGGRTLTVDMPRSADGRLEVALDPGDYFVGVNFSQTNTDWTALPRVYLAATLAVRSDGEDHADVRATPVDVSLRVDGQTVGALPTRKSAYVTLIGPLGQYGLARFTEGEVPRATMALEPGRYEAQVRVSGADDESPVSGHVTQHVDIGANTRALALDLTTVAVSGTVLVNGRVLEASRNQGSIEFIPEGQTSGRTFGIGDTVESTYSGRVYAGTYDVFYDSKRTGITGVPDAVGAVAAGVSVGGRLDANMRTVAISGLVTSRGRALPEVGGPRGEVRMTPVGGRGYATFDLNRTGSATYSGIIWQGEYEVRVEGNGDALSEAARVVRTRWQASTSPLVVDVPTYQVLYSILLENAVPPTRGAGSRYRALLQFRETRTDDIPVSSATVLIPESGPAEGTVRLPEGHWIASMLQTSADWTGMPRGSAVLGEFDLNADRRLDANLWPVRATVRLTRAGRALSAAAAGKVRGTLSMNPFSGFGGSHELGASGDVVFDFVGYPGVYHARVSCAGEAGASTPRGLPAATLLWGFELR